MEISQDLINLIIQVCIFVLYLITLIRMISKTKNKDLRRSGLILLTLSTGLIFTYIFLWDWAKAQWRKT